MKSDVPSATGSLRNATPVSSLTIAHAFQGPSIASLARENGRGPVIVWISEELDALNKICGGGLDQASITYCAELILDRYKFRTVNAFRLALRDGLNSGKIYGKLTYPVIAQWLTEHEEKVEQVAFQNHMGTK